MISKIVWGLARSSQFDVIAFDLSTLKFKRRLVEAAQPETENNQPQGPAS
jgi:hypothetical protein